MGPRRAVLILGVVLVLAVAWRDTDGGIRMPLPSNEIALEIYDGFLPVMRGSANGITNLRFLLDTGASDTAIDRKLAEKLGLQSKPTHVTNFDKTVGSEWTGLREITFGSQLASNVRVMVEDLSYFERAGVHIDGVIGLDQLRRESFIVNYAKKYVVLGPAATTGMRSAPMLESGRVVKVEGEVEGRPLWMVADTGAPTTVLYEDSLKDLDVNYRVAGRMDWVSLGGHIPSRIARVQSFRVGGQDLGSEVVLVSAPGAKRLSGISGYLGIASLGAKEVAFDFEKNRLFWRK